MIGELLQCFLQQSATIMPRKMKREMTIPLRTGAQRSRKAGRRVKTEKFSGVTGKISSGSAIGASFSVSFSITDPLEEASLG